MALWTYSLLLGQVTRGTEDNDNSVVLELGGAIESSVWVGTPPKTQCVRTQQSAARLGG